MTCVKKRTIMRIEDLVIKRIGKKKTCGKKLSF